MGKPSYYAVLPSDIRYDKNITANAKLLYAEITALTNKEGVCWASDQYFMKLYNVKRQTIQRWLKSLEENGYIKREVIYKNGTNEIEKRYIRVYTKLLQGYTQNSDKGIHNNVTENITSINNTSINNNMSGKIPYKEVINYLNDKANKGFRNVESNKKFIRARWNEGYSLEDFKQVIDTMVSEWGNDAKMQNYLRPQTLFSTKFDNYLNWTPTNKLNKSKGGGAKEQEEADRLIEMINKIED